MTRGCVICPRCSGGGDTLETLPRFVRVRRVGPPFVLGGGCEGAEMEERLRERDRPCEDVGGPFADGEGVWRVRKSFGFVAFVVVVFEENEDKPDNDKCELKELTLDGSAPLLLPPLFELLFPEDEDEVFNANG